MGTKQFPKAPLVEVICEINFDPKSEWDPALAGLFYQEIQEDFPERDSVREGFLEFSFNAEKSQEPEISQANNEYPRFLNTTKNIFVIVRRNIISIHNLKPYIGWEDNLLPLITKTIDSYYKIAKPQGIEKIELRYIDKIIFEGEKNIKLSDYFKFRPIADMVNEEKILAINTGVIVEDDDGILRIQLNDIPNEGGKTFLLDTDYFKKENIAQEKIEEWLITAHKKIGNIFDESLTEKTFKKFE